MLNGRYQLYQLISHVGQRCVWKALDVWTGHTVALKGSFGPGEAIIEEFRRLERAEHPRLVRRLELGCSPCEFRGETRPLTWMTQEWLSGPSLMSLVGTLQLDSLRTLATESLELLAFLHTRGFTRLDLKPQHFFQTSAGWKLIDLDQAQHDQPLAEPEMHGTLAYVAPECCLGNTGGPSADLYALGAVLFHVVTGSAPPLHGSTLEAVQHARQNWCPQFPDALKTFAPELTALISSLLKVDPAERPLSAADALKALKHPSHGLFTPLPHGREVGWQSLRLSMHASMEALLLGRGGGLLLSGSAGSGRSRLLRSLRDEYQLQGIPAVWLSASTALQTLLGQPLVAKSVCTHADSRLDESLLKILEMRLAYNTSEAALRASLSVSTEPVVARENIAWGAEEETAHLLTRIQLLQRLANAHLAQSESPLVILLDDVSLAPPATQALLERMASYLPDSGLVLVLAIDAGQDVRPGMTRLPLLSLPNLDLDTLRQLVEDVLGEGYLKTKDSAQHLLLACEGRPGRLRQMLSLQPQLQASSGQASLGAMPAHLQPLGARQPPHSLSNSILRDTGETSQGWHQHQAETLETALLSSPEPLAPAIALHFIQADQLVRARPYLLMTVRELSQNPKAGVPLEVLQALTSLLPLTEPSAVELWYVLGERLVRLGEYRKASDAFKLCLQMSSAMPALRLARLHGRLGEVWLFLGERASAHESLEIALTLVATLPSFIPERLRWHQQLAWLDLLERAVAPARTHLQNARLMVASADSLVSMAASVGTPSHLAIAQLNMIYLEGLLALTAGEDTTLHEPRLLEALTLARSLQAPTHETKLLNLLARLTRQRGDRAATRTHLQALVARARESWDPGQESLAAYNQATFLSEESSDAEALTLFERASQLAQAAGNRSLALQALLENVALLLEHDRLDRAEVALEQFQRLLSEETHPAPVLEVANRLFRLRLQLMRTLSTPAPAPDTLGELETAMERLAPDIGPLPFPELRFELTSDRMRLALARQQPLRAVSLFQALLQVPQDPQQNTVPSRLWARLHRLAIRAHCACLGSEATLPPEKVPGPETTPHPFPGPDNRQKATAHPAIERTSPPQVQNAPSRSPGLSDSAAAPPIPGTLSSPDWLQRLERLLQVADNEDLLAAELAALAGSLLQGRGLAVLFDGCRPLVGKGVGIDIHEIDDVSSTLIEQVRRDRKPFVCPDVRASPLLGEVRSLRDARVRSVLCQPVLLDNACLGALYIDHMEVGRVTEPVALALMEQVASLAAGLLETVLARRRRSGEDSMPFGLVGSSEPMQQLRSRLKGLAESSSGDLVVLLLGETGTGKSTLARLLHQQSQRKNGPFISVNAAAIPETLFESQLYGYSKGAFTGAVTSHPGWLEAAAGGTLFLDEIGDMPLTQQVRLLETLGGNRSYRRLGDHQERILDVHLFCATSKDLNAEVRAGRFRPELLRRIQVNICRIPTLRERGPEDILLHSRHLITDYLRKHSLLPPAAPLVELEDFVTRSGREFLARYDWPFNVGQLENVFRNEGLRARLRSRGHDKIDVTEIQEALGHTSTDRWAPLVRQGDTSTRPPAGLSYKAIDLWYEQQKARHIQHLLDSSGESITALARRLRCSRDVIYKYLQPEPSAP